MSQKAWFTINTPLYKLLHKSQCLEQHHLVPVHVMNNMNILMGLDDSK